MDFKLLLSRSTPDLGDESGRVVGFDLGSASRFSGVSAAFYEVSFRSAIDHQTLLFRPRRSGSGIDIGIGWVGGSGDRRRNGFTAQDVEDCSQLVSELM